MGAIKQQKALLESVSNLREAAINAVKDYNAAATRLELDSRMALLHADSNSDDYNDTRYLVKVNDGSFWFPSTHDC